MTAELKRIDYCTSCGAPIIWAETSAGNRMPVDAVPTPRGMIKLYPAPDPGKAMIAIIVKAGPEGERYTSHFATCAEAARHRRVPKKRPVRKHGDLMGSGYEPPTGEACSWATPRPGLPWAPCERQAVHLRYDGRRARWVYVCAVHAKEAVV